MPLSINVQVKFYYYGIVKKTENKTKVLLCFNHAVQKAIKGQHIDTEITDDESYYYCDVCDADENEDV